MNKDDEKKDKAKESMETFGFSSRKWGKREEHARNTQCSNISIEN